MNRLHDSLKVFGVGILIIVFFSVMSYATDLDYFLVIFIIVPGMPLFLAGAVLSILEGRFWLQFQKTFKVRPPQNHNEQTLMHTLVDEKLTRLAVVFQLACDDEVRYQQILGEAMHPEERATIPKELTAQLERLRRQRENLKLAKGDVRYQKERFWRAHRIAKHFGFVVRSSYKEYLSAKQAAEQTA